MPFSRPSLEDLIRRAEGDVESRVTGTPLLRKSLLRVIARIVAGAAHMLYGYLSYLAENLLPDRAEDEWLRRWAVIYGIEELPASYADGSATSPAADGITVPAETILVRQDGVTYRTTDIAVASGGSVTVPIEAVEPGANGNTSAGTSLSLQSPVSGVTGPFTVDADITNGAEEETIEQLRERILLRIQNPPQGGAEADYVMWALSVPGVTRAWAYGGWLGAGTVGVAIVNDSADPITPGQDLIDDVQEYIEPRRPVTADVTVFAPTLLPVDLTIELSPPSAQPAVTASLGDFFQRNGEPGAIIYLSQISEAISVADGEEWHRITSPTDNVTPQPHEIPVLGAITWV